MVTEPENEVKVWPNELALKDVYSAIVADIRHLHNRVWGARQIFITVSLASILVIPKLGTPTPGQSLAVALILFGATVVMLLVDRRYQMRKVKLRKQLHDLEAYLEVDPKWRLGNKNEKVGHFYVVYLVILATGLPAFLVSLV